MAADINETRRKKILVHLLEEGGTVAIGPLHDWSGVKLLAAHQAFSQLMEGLTGDGLVGWDGQIFTLTSEGRAVAEAAVKEKPARGRKKAAPADDTAGAPLVMAPEVAPEAPAARGGHDHGHSHDHDHDHDHGHDHGRNGNAVARPVPGPIPEAAPPKAAPPAPAREPAAAAPAPAPPPKPTGLRATVKGLLKSLIGRK